ncbi:hypothetical protein [Asanoa iriomotensis]|uniref:Superfamily III holin-X n=1 Tax=Asanoa iriomotensis TaxID=234613 RepID=A0ABQ4CEP4_9ACTN|nr:hypothetical protein [Asanoa iriomotensis]GIF61246.1 hypothetical protein Air01nite_73410 [Asanoa iriomotensis]
MGLTAEERDRLRSNAERATASSGVIVLVLLLFFGALAAMFAARGGVGELPLPWNVLVALLPFVVFAALLTPLLIRVRRRGDVPLVEGADSATREAAVRAIQAGSTDDPRIDDLVVDMRDRGMARRLGFTAVTQVVAALAFVTAAVIAGELVARLLLLGAAVGTLTAAGLLLRRRRRLLAYRAGTTPSAGPPAAAKGD